MRRFQTMLGALCLALLFCGPFADAQEVKDERELVAVMDLQAVQATPAEVQALTDRLREVLHKSGRFKLVERGQMDAVLNEQALQQTGCTSQECAVQVGRILGVRKLVVGKVVKVSDEVWLLSAALVDVETAETLRAESVRHKGDYFALMDERVREIGEKMAGAGVAGGTASTAAAIAAAPAMPDPPPASAQPRKVLAIFPPHLESSYLRQVHLQMAGDLKHDLSQRTDVELRFAALSIIADGTRVRDLSEVPEIQDSSWEGFFTKEPNRSYVLRTASTYGVDVVVMYRLTGERGGGTYKVYVLDVRSGRGYEDEGKWEVGGWNLSVREGVKYLLNRYMASS
jgi:hypothetical protein